MSQPRQRGFILIAMSVCMFLLLAVIGMAFDLGRVYIARNEAQIFTDAASMAAAKQLDGTAAGLDRARAAVSGLPNRWNLGTENFSGVVIEFSADGKQWEQQPQGHHGAPLRTRDGSGQSRRNHVPARRGRAAGISRFRRAPWRRSKPVRLTE